MSFLSGSFHTKRWAGYFLVAGGIAMVIGGIWFAQKAADFLDRTARADGTVMALQRKTGTKGTPLDFPVVRFHHRESGAAVEFKSGTGLWPSPFSVGEAVVVAYDPADPSQAEIDSFWTTWFMPLLLGLFGLSCIAAGAHTLRSTKVA